MLSFDEDGGLIFRREDGSECKVERTCGYCDFCDYNHSHDYLREVSEGMSALVLCPYHWNVFQENDGQMRRPKQMCGDCWIELVGDHAWRVMEQNEDIYQTIIESGDHCKGVNEGGCVHE